MALEFIDADEEAQMRYVTEQLNDILRDPAPFSRLSKLNCLRDIISVIRNPRVRRLFNAAVLAMELRCP